MGSAGLMFRRPDCRLGGLLFSSTRFKTWGPTLLCLSEETLKAVVPFSLVSMQMEVKYPSQGRWKWNRYVVDSLTKKKKNHCYLTTRYGCFQLNVISQCHQTSAASTRCTKINIPTGAVNLARTGRVWRSRASMNT